MFRNAKFFAVLLLFAAAVLAVDGLAVLSAIPDNTWLKLPVDGAVFGPNQAHSNIVVDVDSNRVWTYGSDTHGSNYNCIYYFNLTDFTWHQVYPQDPLTDYRQVTGAVLGSGEYWASTVDEHPVASHTFDGARYIPGRFCMLVLQSHPHNANVGSTLGSGAQPTSWLFDTQAMRWTLLRNDRAPNASIYCKIGTTPDGQTTIASLTTQTYIFDWTDSTWNQLSTTGQPPATYHMSIEYDTYLDKFVALGGSAGYSLRTFDPSTRVWTQVEAVGEGPNMNGTNVGYDTLNRVMVAHVADNNDTYTNASGNAATLVRHSETGVWDTMLTTRRGDTVPPHYGFCFRAEYDMRNNVCYFLTRSSASTSDIWAYRYKNEPSTAAGTPAAVKPAVQLSVSPNPFSRTISINMRNGSGSVTIFDARGRSIAALEPAAPGRYLWRPRALPAGVYVLRARSLKQTVTKRVLYVP